MWVARARFLPSAGWEAFSEWGTTRPEASKRYGVREDLLVEGYTPASAGESFVGETPRQLSVGAEGELL